MHQPVKLLLDISPSLNSHHNNIDIWRGMWDGQKLTSAQGGWSLAGSGGGSRNSSSMSLHNFILWCRLKMGGRDTLLPAGPLISSFIWDITSYPLSTTSRLYAAFSVSQDMILGLEGVGCCLLKLQILEPTYDLVHENVWREVPGI